MKPWMMCEKVYQSARCCEFSELCTTPCHSLTDAAGADGNAAHRGENRGLNGEKDDDGEQQLRAAQCRRRGRGGGCAHRLSSVTLRLV